MEYGINKGIGKSVEFRGLKAQYLFIFAGGLLAVFVVFVILYMAGVDQWVCIAFGVTTCGAGEVVKAVRRVYPKTLIVKLSPNVTDITEIAKAVEAEGADSVSLINTMLGMAIDAEKRKPILSTITGGLSGPCVKPVALRMVWQTYHAVKIPIIGLGGISNWKDAVEFMLAGASAIQIGTYNFVDPTVSIKVIDGLNDYCDRHGFKSVKELIGALDIQR